MQLSLTNNTQEPEAIAAPDGSFADALTPGTPYDFSNDAAQVLVIGDKPDVREQLQQAAGVLSGIAKHLLTLIAGRKQQAQAANVNETVDVTILNRGAKSIRVNLGDGVTDQQVDAGQSATVRALGYVELRELGDLDPSQVDGGTQPAIA